MFFIVFFQAKKLCLSAVLPDLACDMLRRGLLTHAERRLKTLR
jgi:hypothetical protein